MSKQDFIEAAEYIGEILGNLFELEIANPVWIISIGLIMFVVNIFLINKLSSLAHIHKSWQEVLAITYYVFELINFIIAYYMVNILIKKYNSTKKSFAFYIAIVINIINPIIYAALFY